MTISATVSVLANVLREHVAVARPDDEKLLKFLGTVARMPEYCADSHLEDWERSVQAVNVDSDVWMRDSDPFFSAAEEIFELGRLNLYSRTQPAAIRDQLQSALRESTEHA